MVPARMESPHPEPACLLRPHHHGDPFLHLPRRLFGKGERKNPVRAHALLDEEGDPGRQHPGLAGTGPRDDKHGALDTGYGRLLFFIEIIQ